MVLHRERGSGSSSLDVGSSIGWSDWERRSYTAIPATEASSVTAKPYKSALVTNPDADHVDVFYVEWDAPSNLIQRCGLLRSGTSDRQGRLENRQRVQVGRGGEDPY